MRLERSSIDAKHGIGKVSLIPEEPEDMWHAYNLIQPYDRLRARAVRKVKKEGSSGTVTSKSMVLDLTISVISTDFDIGAGQLHVSGRVAVENEHVKIGSHHTLDLELHRRFVLVKGEDEKGGLWDSVALEMLREACETERKAELWAIVMGEGIANICLITEHQTILRQRIEIAVPRKRRGGIDGHDKGMDKFFSTTLATLLRHMEGAKANASNPEKTVPLLIASPGFVAQAFFQYIKSEATRTMSKQLMAIIPSVLVAHSSSHHVHALKEVLASSTIMSQLSDTKFAKETALMDRLTTLIRLDDGRAWYGPREVERAVEKGAVGRGGGVLLLSNALFRAQDVAERKRWVRLVDRVRDVEGGEVRVLSSLHESGKRLESLGNIAAILTFPLEDLDIDDEQDDIGAREGAAEGIVI
jgi:protein pelota